MGGTAAFGTEETLSLFSRFSMKVLIESRGALERLDEGGAFTGLLLTYKGGEGKRKQCKKGRQVNACLQERHASGVRVRTALTWASGERMGSTSSGMGEDSTWTYTFSCPLGSES